MINPPEPIQSCRPHVSSLGLCPQTISPTALPPSDFASPINAARSMSSIRGSFTSLSTTKSKKALIGTESSERSTYPSTSSIGNT